jgi:rhodanese-related sulfurtransferase
MNAMVAGFQLAIPAGHIPGAINLPRDRWHTLDKLRQDKTNVLYCYSQVCHLAATAAVEFTTEG